MKRVRNIFQLSSCAALVLMVSTVSIRAAELDIPVKTQVAYPHLVFDRPVDFQSPKDGSNRIFVVEQLGQIKVFKNSPESKSAGTFLDIRNEVFSGHGEEGLLGLAFHPNYKRNGYFYIYHTANEPRRSRLIRYKVSDEHPNIADVKSKKILMEILQPYGNHNGGQISFGPDGYLYISLGDGGSGGDPHGNAQNLATLLGKILRIDVNSTEADAPYSIPPDNPFAGNSEGYREEIYAYGLRNPWRFSFDTNTGKLWAADVGQDKPWEEINIIEKGKNYGWNHMEGKQCFKPPIACRKKGLELPIWQYTQDMGRSITGGFVYRGRKVPFLKGKYIYADFLSGRIWALTYNGREVTENLLIEHNTDVNVSSFGIDQNNELYFCSFDGRIYKFFTAPVPSHENQKNKT